jgi:ribosome-binding protein aMBF1 (putative translation factor)
MNYRNATPQTRAAFAARLRDARLRLRLPRRAAAERWDIAERSLEAWEAGTKMPIPFIRRHLERILEKIEGGSADTPLVNEPLARP